MAPSERDHNVDPTLGTRGTHSTEQVDSLERERSVRPCLNRLGATLERAVFWQCAFYLGAFYLAWPIVIAGQFIVANSVPISTHFWFVVFALAPLQGFWNCIVYARPRLQECWAERTRKRSLEQQRRSHSIESLQARNRRDFLMSHDDELEESNNSGAPVDHEQPELHAETAEASIPTMTSSPELCVEESLNGGSIAEPVLTG